MAQLSQATQKLIYQYESWHESLQSKEGAATIHVDEAASKVAAFYEKIRGIIDWKEEHLLKKGAIERSLKRKLFGIDLTNGLANSIAESLVLELIRGGHFPNDKIEEIKITEVQKAIDKYIFILNHSPQNQNKSKIRFPNWLYSIAACEIEEILSPSLKERSLINYMFEQMRERIRLNKKIEDKEKNIQIYIAVQKTLFNLDTPIISYHILKYKYPQWKNPDQNQLAELAKNIYFIWEALEKDFSHPLSGKFYQICEKYNTPFLLFGDILSKNLKETKEKINNPEALEFLIKKAYEARLKTLKSRLGRAAFYATLSIFLTNVVSLLAIEIPFTKIATGQFNFWAIAIDIFIPTLLMYFLVVTIKPPKKENLGKVVMEAMKIVYDNKEKDTYEIKMYRKGGFIFKAIINLFYLIFFILVLGLIVLGLKQVHFPILSYFIFIIFLSLIAFAGAKIRQKARELHMTEEKGNFLSFILDPFALPIIHLGKWLTTRWKRYNLIAAFFTALIDMPFLVFIEFIEQWRYFLKEKKEKIH